MADPFERTKQLLKQLLEMCRERQTILSSIKGAAMREMENSTRRCAPRWVQQLRARRIAFKRHRCCGDSRCAPAAAFPVAAYATSPPPIDIKGEGRTIALTSGKVVVAVPSTQLCDAAGSDTYLDQDTSAKLVAKPFVTEEESVAGEAVADVIVDYRDMLQREADRTQEEVVTIGKVVVAISNTQLHLDADPVAAYTTPPPSTTEAGEVTTEELIAYEAVVDAVIEPRKFNGEICKVDITADGTIGNETSIRRITPSELSVARDTEYLDNDRVTEPYIVDFGITGVLSGVWCSTLQLATAYTVKLPSTSGTFGINVSQLNYNNSGMPYNRSMKCLSQAVKAVVAGWVLLVTEGNTFDPGITVDAFYNVGEWCCSLLALMSQQAQNILCLPSIMQVQMDPWPPPFRQEVMCLVVVLGYGTLLRSH